MASEECRAPFTRGVCTCLQCKNKACMHAVCQLRREEREALMDVDMYPHMQHMQHDRTLLPGCCCRALFDATVRTYGDAQHSVCWKCAEAIKGPHGARCCQWVWPARGGAFRTSVLLGAAEAAEAAESSTGAGGQHAPQSWACRKCHAHVAHPPRAFEGGPEPAWWWWCPACRKSTACKPGANASNASTASSAGQAKESARSKRQRLAAAGSRDLRQTFRRPV